MRSILLLSLLSLAACDRANDTGEVPYDPTGWPLGEIQAVEGKGILAVLDTPQGPIQVLRVRGTHAEMGRQMGVLIGPQVPPMWDTFMEALTAEMDMPIEVAEGSYAPLMGDVWDRMVPTIPQPWLDLSAAMQEAAAWDKDVCYPCRVVGISNVSDLNFEDEIQGLLTINDGTSEQLDDYYAEGEDAAAMPRPHGADPVPNPFASCSFFGAWGERTQDGHYLGSRNLDWNADTGIGPLRLLTIYVPEGDGAGHPFATLGYTGMIGALAGISSAGLAVSEVGSTGVLERLLGEPWVLRNMDILEHAQDLDAALAYHTNQAPDGFHRPQTIGYNFGVGYGDPAGGGAAAEGAVVEANGAMVSIFRGGAGGGAEVHWFDVDGVHERSAVLGDGGVNAEADAVEIDAAGQARTFAYAEGAFVQDAHGNYVEDPEGLPMPTGQPLAQALFRGDEAMSHANRRFQMAAHGPQDGDGLMVTSGSYRDRYTPSHDMLQAWAAGTAYEDDGEVLIPDNGGIPVPIGLEEGVTLTSHVAMGSNILSVVYDATSLEIMFSYEQGTGETWEPASAQEYAYVDLKPAFEFE
ncbi:MAG: hypothetical protein ABIO70_26245 [Pseudomonadota bacterium]